MWVWEEQIWNFLTTATSAALEGYLAFHFKVRITIAGKEALEKKNRNRGAETTACPGSCREEWRDLTGHCSSFISVAGTEHSGQI